MNKWVTVNWVCAGACVAFSACFIRDGNAMMAALAAGNAAFCGCIGVRNMD